MAGYDANPDLVAHHNHGDIVHAELLLEEFRVAGVGEAFRIHGPLVDGRGDQDVYLSVFQVLDGGIQRGNGVFGAFRGALAGLCVYVVRQAVYEVDFARAGVCCGRDDIDVHRPHVVQGFAVKAHELG